MKVINIFIAGLLIISVASCKKNTLATSGDVAISMNNVANGNPITLGALNNTNALGSTFSVDMLKYYVSKMVLVSDAGSDFEFNNYDLIDIADPTTLTIQGSAIPNGHYSKLKFALGIDSLRNHTGAQEGDLDPLYGMIWTWSTGYIFFKHEGRFIKTDLTEDNLLFHLGTDRAYTMLEIPIDLKVEGANKKLIINFDVAKMYNSPALDFNVMNINQSTTAADFPWIDDMKANAIDAFSFNRSE
ncbi:MAG: hypothetical protein IPI46_11095 [Bacteroidetes bacterium]|nr:hypothetical protein [Bacteroidota bacterium]